MISKEAIVKLARQQGVDSRLVEKDYLIQLFLSRLYPRVLSRLLVFKGGTCLRLFYGLKRYSEDIDFTTITAGVADIERELERSAHELGLLNIAAKIIKGKPNKEKNSLNYVLKFKGPLSELVKKESSSISINVSMREKVTYDDIELLVLGSGYGEVRNPQVPTLNEVNIMAEKFRAAVTRKELKVRDFYDIWHLLANRQVPVRFEIIHEKMKVYGKPFILADFYANLSKARDGWDKYLLHLLPVDARIPYELVEHGIKEHIKSNIAATVENVIFDASKRELRATVGVQQTGGPNDFEVTLHTSRKLTIEEERFVEKNLKYYGLQPTGNIGRKFAVRVGPT